MKEQIEAIIKRLSLHEEYNHMTFVGRHYSKLDLIRDLTQLLKEKEDGSTK